MNKRGGGTETVKRLKKMADGEGTRVPGFPLKSATNRSFSNLFYFFVCFSFRLLRKIEDTEVEESNGLRLTEGDHKSKKKVNCCPT